MSDAARTHQGKLAIITGSSRGIGAYIARKLASQGANILINYTSESSDGPASALSKELQDTHSVKAVPCRADISTKAGCARIISVCRDNFGGDSLRISIIVHNAAVLSLGTVETVEPEDFDRMYHVNVLGPILLTGACKPHLPTDRSGRIVMMSSINSKVGTPQTTLYSGTKAAMETMARVWCRELSENCTVNTINPGPVMTDMYMTASDEIKYALGLWNPLTPLVPVRDTDTPEVQELGNKFGGRAAYPEEIADLVAMICSPWSLTLPAWKQTQTWEAMEKRVRKATVEDLPEECLALVFSRLPSKEDKDAAALTCRRWHAVKAHTSHTLHCNLWRQTGAASHMPPRILSVLRSYPHILHIFINGYMEHLDDAFCAAFRNRDFAHLQSLHLSSMFADITNKGLVSLAHGCPALCHLAVHSPSISDAGLHALAHSCPLLVSLDLSYCSLITDAGIDDILAGCHNMEKLLMNSCPNVKGWGLRHGKKLQALELESCRIAVAGLAQGIHGMASLQVLRMPNIKGRRKMVAQIGECCKLLKVIDVSNCMILDNRAVQKIAQGCPDLRVCDMSRCHHVSLNGWQALALSATKLEELDVSRCKQFCLASLLALQNGCPSLLKLDLLPDYFVWHLAIERFRLFRPDVKIAAYVRRQ